MDQPISQPIVGWASPTPQILLANGNAEPERHCTGPSGRSQLRVIYRPVETLRLDPKNPRQHSQRQIRQIARSIDAFDFNVPILVDAELNVIAGHGRLLACRQLGWKEVPTICLEHLNEAQRRAFMIADNKLTEASMWNAELLAGHLKELSLLDLNFSLEATGFEMGEIDLRIEELEGGIEKDDPADLLPQQSGGPVTSRTGDLWQLGSHRVLCASALDPEALKLLMGTERATTVFTDPPYNVRIDGHVSGLGSVRHREFAMASGEMTGAAFTNFLSQVCLLLARHSHDGSIHFICMDWRHVGELLAAGTEIYSELKNICVWAKHNAGMGSFYRNQHELVFVFKHGRAPHRNNIQLGQHGRNRSNVWFYRGANDFGRGTDEGDLLKLHPTVKPVVMVADAIRDCSARGEVVLDAFLGSGTTVIAAERTGRRCFGLEIDPSYVDTIVRRWRAFTGDDARLQATGQTFDQIMLERGGRNVG